jgi:hypothetical protein
MSNQPDPRPTPPDKPASVRILKRSRALCCATVGNVLTLVWKQPPRPETMRESTPLFDALLAENPSGIGVLTIVLRSDAEEAVRLTSGSTERWDARVAAVATVVGGDDAFGWLRRAEMRLGALLHGRTDECFFSETSRACDWLHSVLDARGSNPPDAVSLRAAIEWLLDYYRPLFS